MKNKSEKSQIYCSFFNNVGSCMHGEACSKIHVHPNISKTILLANLYPNPLKFISMLPEHTLIIEPDTLTRNFDEFYFDIYEELRTYGPIEDLLVAGNLCDHLVGNVLVRFVDELDAVNALDDLQHRFYAGRPIDAQFSPVENLQESTCKQYFTNECKHGENCNFIHPMYPSDYVLKECQLAQERSDSYSIPSMNEKEYCDERRRSRMRDRNYESEKDTYRKREKHDSRRLRDDSPPKDRNYDRKYRSELSLRDRDRNYRSDKDDRSYRNEKNYRIDDREDRDKDRGRDRNEDRDRNYRSDRDRGSRDRDDDRDRNYRNDRDRGNRDKDDERDRSYRNDRSERNDRDRLSRNRDDKNDRGYRSNERDRSSERNDRDKGRIRNDRERDDNNDWERGEMRDYDASYNSSSSSGYTRTRAVHRNHF